MNCPDNDFDDCEEYQMLIEQQLALTRLFEDAQQSQRFLAADIISEHLQTVVRRRAEHFDKHYRSHIAKR